MLNNKIFLFIFLHKKKDKLYNDKTISFTDQTTFLSPLSKQAVHPCKLFYYKPTIKLGYVSENRLLLLQANYKDVASH